MNDSKNFVSIQVPVEDASKALVALSSYGLTTIEAKLEDVPKALIALRTYGMTEKEAEHIINVEELLVQDYDRNQQNSLAPELIELFGFQHMPDALSYTYLYLEDFKLYWTEYKVILCTLLQVYRPEELIANPKLIRCFISKLNLADKRIFDRLKDMEDSVIKEMADEDYYDEDYDN